MRWGKVSFLLYSHEQHHQSALTDDCCSDGRWGVVVVPSAGETWDDDRMTARWEGDQDSTLVFCESTSCMLMTSVLTPLSYTGLSKADSSVMLSYGGEDVGILIDFPWSLCKEKRERGTSCKGSVGSKMKWIKVWSYYSLWKVDINPEDNHQDDCSWNKNGKGDIGSLHAIIHINNWKEKHRKKRHYFLLLCTQKKYQYIDIAMSQNMTHHLACVHSHIGPRTLQRHNGRLVSIWTGVM